jgi:DNA ligase D-like protein (predicted 3'-phosphoesterase)
LNRELTSNTLLISQKVSAGGRNYEDEEDNEGMRLSRTNGAVVRFLIHQHKSNSGRLTYYLRLERDGAFKGWAIPKGIPKEWKTRHIAIQVGDLNLNKADSEGKIENGKFGPGIITILDRGEYRVRSWGDDKIIFDLAGSRTKGSFALVLFPKAGPLHWLFSQTHESSASSAINSPETVVKKPEESSVPLPSQAVPAKAPTAGIKEAFKECSAGQNSPKDKSSKLKTKTTEWRLYQPDPKPKPQSKPVERQIRKPRKNRDTKGKPNYKRKSKTAGWLNKNRHTREGRMVGWIYMGAIILFIFGLVKLIQYLKSIL